VAGPQTRAAFERIFQPILCARDLILQSQPGGVSTYLFVYFGVGLTLRESVTMEAQEPVSSYNPQTDAESTVLCPVPLAVHLLIDRQSAPES
jgi:hypothetical protein